jgi:hypothetical protein
MSTQAFQAQGNTVTFSATSTQSSTVQVPASNSIGSCNYKIQNTGPNTVFWVASASLQNSNGTLSAPSVTVGIPAIGTPANGVPLQSGASQTITAAPNCWFTVICASTQTATVYVTPGEGK